MRDEEEMNEPRLQSDADHGSLKPHSSSLTPPPGSINPLALPIPDAAKVLSKTGGRVIRADQLETDVAAGAPQNDDGTISLIAYAAWLARQASGSRRLQTSGFRKKRR